MTRSAGVPTAVEVPDDARIYINGRWLYLEAGPRLRGRNGDSEQCEDCGEDVVAAGCLTRTGVVCLQEELDPIDRAW